jgi:adenylate cyclase
MRASLGMLMRSTRLGASYASVDFGARLRSLSEKSAGSGARMLHATILFIDIVGSTAQAAELGNRRWALRVERYFAIVRRALRTFSGSEIHTNGDGFLVLFDAPTRAITCASTIRTALKELSVEIRAGLHTGEFEVLGSDLAGIAVHIAARVATAAAPGEILVTNTVKEVLAGSDVRFEDRGPHQLHGVPDEWRLYLAKVEDAPEATPVSGERFFRARGVLVGGVIGVGALLLAGLLVVRERTGSVQNPSLASPTLAPIALVEPTPLPLPDKPSIAVLPFDNLSRDSDQEYFSDGITDDLISNLSRLPGLFVIARTSSFSYRGKPAKLQQIGTELGVKYVLEGSVRKAGGEVGINVQLADAGTGQELWAERYDRPLRDIFAVQDEIVRRIVTTLNLQINLAQKGFFVPRGTENLEAYDDLLRGVQQALDRTREGFAKARGSLEKAIALDPKYAAAYSFLAANYYFGAVYGYNPDPGGVAQAYKLARQALALDDTLPRAHSILAAILVLSGQHDQALGEAEQGVALGPNFPSSYLWYAQVLNEIGKPAEALVAANQAIRLDPRNDDYLFQQGWAYMLLGRWEEAIPPMRRYAALYPANFWCHVIVAESDMHLGDVTAARTEAAEVQRAAGLAPNSAYAAVALADVMNGTGRPTEALAAADGAMRLDPDHATDYMVEKGWSYSQLGRWQESIAALNRRNFIDNPWAHVYLAVDYAELGKEDMAANEIAEVLKIEPAVSLKTAAALYPAAKERAAHDLRKAGLK